MGVSNAVTEVLTDTTRAICFATTWSTGNADGVVLVVVSELTCDGGNCRNCRRDSHIYHGGQVWLLSTDISTRPMGSIGRVTFV